MLKIWNFLIRRQSSLYNIMRQWDWDASKLWKATQQERPKIRNKKSLKRTLRWGIAPVSRIADDFATSLQVLPKFSHKITAVASPYRSQADAFASKHSVPKIYTSFGDLARCKEVDAVYISPLVPWHYELGIIMLNHGKHVLCERPLCVNERQASQLIGRSHGKRRFLMEAMWSRFLPAYQFLREKITDGSLGDVYEVTCNYGLPLDNLERVVKKKLGGGVTMELGSYALQFVQWVYRIPPHKIRAKGELNNDGVDVTADIELNYNCDRKATIKLSSKEDYENIARIRGTKGIMTIPDYWCPTKIIDIDGEEKIFSLPKGNKPTNYPQRIAMCFEAEEVRQCLMNNMAQSERFPHNETLTIIRIQDEIRRQLGVVYPEDKIFA